MTDASNRPAWTFLANHGHVLICIGRDPEARLRDIAAAVGITERAVFGIIDDLEAAGIVVRSKVGRRNRYAVVRSAPLRHPLEAHQSVGDLLDLLATPPAEPVSPPRPR
jgi:hypothetical protein